MKVGYVRVSTQEQILDLQLDALEKAWVLEDLYRKSIGYESL